MTCHSFVGKEQLGVAYRTTEKMAARKDARRKSFLDAATHLFGGHGYHATTVPMIVAKAGSSTGSFYMYFRNKEDVFSAALEALGERTLKVVHDAHATVTDPLSQIRAAVESLFLFLAENPREARIMIVESSGLSPRLEQVRRTILARHVDEVRKNLRALGRSTTTVNPAIAARCLVGAVFESLYAWLESPDSERPPAATVARVVANYNMRALSDT
jgi:TetR/AcrR family transcriptional regulator, fatty acid metabolism regulator protein